MNIERPGRIPDGVDFQSAAAATLQGMTAHYLSHSTFPLKSGHTALVHAARASDVRLTLVAGRVLYRDGSWTTLDPDTVRAEARAEARGLARRAELSAAA